MSNKKIIIAGASALAIAAMSFGAYAFFHSEDVGTPSDVKVGTVTMEANSAITHSKGINNLNPGDNDPKTPEGNRPGTDHELKINVNNTGSKSTITRILVEVKGSAADGHKFTAADLKNVLLYKNVSEKISANHTVGDSDKASENDKNKFSAENLLVGTKAVDSHKQESLVYVLGGTTKVNEDYVMSGSDEKEGSAPSNRSYVLDIGMSKDASNDFAGAALTFKVTVQSMQYRNTGDNDWTTVSEDTYSIGNAVGTH